MRHLTVESKDLLIGDEAAAVLTEYAALIAERGLGDHVEVHAFGADGDEVVADIVLSSGSALITQTAHNSLPEPDNSEVIAYMRERMQNLRTPPPAQPETPPESMSAWERQFDEL